MKPLRSVLFVPGHRGTWAEKAVASGADGLIFDLEDSVPTDLKQLAREETVKSIHRLRESGCTVGIYIRLNALETGITGDDLEVVAVAGLDGFVLPKTYGASDIVRFDALVTHFERRNGVAANTFEFICALETAEAYSQVELIAVASPRVVCIFAGTARDADVSRSVGFRFTPGGAETLYLRSRAVLASRSTGLVHPLVGVWQDLADPEGVEEFSRQNRDLGFKGQVLIHPSHVALANEIFSPSKDDVEFYSGMIRAFEEAEASGVAAVVYEGMHIDYAHVKTAREVLEQSARLTSDGH